MASPLNYVVILRFNASVPKVSDHLIYGPFKTHEDAAAWGEAKAEQDFRPPPAIEIHAMQKPHALTWGE